jgi:hypothetical protein
MMKEIRVIPVAQSAVAKHDTRVETISVIWRCESGHFFSFQRIPSVVDLLKNGGWDTRERGILILGNMNSPAARKALQDRLAHETDPSRKKYIQQSLRP